MTDVAADDTQKTSLSLSNAELGKTIIERAKVERGRRYEAKIIQIADSLMEAMANAQKKIDYHQIELDTSKKRLAAIEAGQFTISERGAFQFDDADLKIRTGDEPIAEIVLHERKIAFGSTER